MSVGRYPLGPDVASGLPVESVTTLAKQAACPGWAAGQVRSLPCGPGAAYEAGAVSAATVRAAPTETASATCLMCPPREKFQKCSASLHGPRPGVQYPAEVSAWRGPR